MAGGSLERRLHPTNRSTEPLTFNQRKVIAIGTARGLQYLHTYNSKPLIHGDIKPANILLDSCCVPKIGDFGLVREGSIESMEVSSVYGTNGCLPNEFLVQRTLSTKIDTYSYGVVLFELMTGLRAVNKERADGNKLLAKYMWSTFTTQGITKTEMRKLIDKSMYVDDFNLDSFEEFIKTALICTIEQLERRPEMVDVHKKLVEFFGEMN